MSNCRIALALAVALVLPSTGVVQAGEPHGYTVMTVDWVEDPGRALGTDERVLRVSVRAAVPVGSATLGFRQPDDISLTPITGPAGGTPDSAPITSFTRTSTTSSVTARW